jgi:hypothetical protein
MSPTPMITGRENICTLLSILHDGVISSYCVDHDNLGLTVDIKYLANRINPAYSYFTLTVFGVSDVSFRTWPRHLQSEPWIITDLQSIFAARLEILEATVVDAKIDVRCDQPDTSLDYCGGELRLNAVGLIVKDEDGRERTLDEMDQICQDYWNEWERSIQKE